MTRFALFAFVLMASAPVVQAQRGFPAPDPAVIAAVDHLKDKCTKDTPCTYKVENRGPVSIVTVEFTRQETPDAKPKPYPGGRAKLTIDKQGKVVNRVDG